jgi:gliding motility-associated-like protein
MAMPDVAQVMPSEEVAVEPMLKEPVATEVVAINASTVPPEPAKTEQAVVTEPVALMPATQAEVTAVVSQPSVTTQPMQAIPISKPVSEVVPVVAAAPVETQPSVNTSTVASEPAKSQTKSPTTFGLEDTILWLPNVFMPASDDAEINVFRARLNHPGDVLTNYRMTVFNRSGAQVFATTDINEGWDGKHWGRELPQAAYVYVVYYTDKDGFRHQRKGTVTLVR